MRLNRHRLKMWFYGLMTLGCCFETIGCPQLFGNALRDGTRTFLEGGLTTVLLAAIDFEALLGLNPA